MEAPADEGAVPARGRGWDRRRTIAAIAGGVIVAGVITLLVIGLVNRDVGTSIQDTLDEGERPDAPAFTAPVLLAADGIGPVGSDVSLADLSGRTVVLNFWASWCEPCEREAPILNEVARRYRGRAASVVVLGLDVQDLSEKALAFARDFGISYPSLREAGDAAYRDYQLTGLPETFVIDPEGRIALKVVGEVTDPVQLTNAIDQL
jgi:cytochrome c biogenesis protein CcmG, thiol:disulfide interchange protein DsbE